MLLYSSLGNNSETPSQKIKIKKKLRKKKNVYLIQEARVGKVFLDTRSSMVGKD